jgi:23S rRNA pseudouridine2604 synthase
MIRRFEQGSPCRSRLATNPFQVEPHSSIFLLSAKAMLLAPVTMADCQPGCRAMTESLRLAKRLAQLLQCSRREAELYIAGGWVRVDGVVVEEPQFRVTDQKIELDSQARAEPLEPATILLHQPPNIEPEAVVQLISPASHAPDDPSNRHVLKGHFARLSPTLPLQPGAEGLVVFTQDWRVLRKLTEDADRVEQEYVIEVAGTIVPGGLELLRHGLSFKGKALPSIKASWQNENRLRFALKDPLPGQLRHVCEEVGLSVVAMKRIRIGGVPLAKLPPGQWRYLGPRERF